MPIPAVKHPAPANPQALAQIRIARAQKMSWAAWQNLARGNPQQCRALARSALRHTHLLAQHLRRARARSSPPPAWAGPIRQELMLLRMELSELHAHFTHPTAFGGGVGAA